MKQAFDRDHFTKMEVNDILWTWTWKKKTTDDYEPVDILPTCSEKQCNHLPLSNIKVSEYRTKYLCNNCGREYKDIDNPRLIKEMIEYQYK